MSGERERQALRHDAQGKRFGRQCGGFFAAFARWIVENGLEDGVSKVFFLTREGVFFKAVLDELAVTGEPGLDYDLLHVSRMSTFLPSMNRFDRADWDRFLNQYKDQGIAAFARSMGTPYEETMDILRRGGLREDVSIAEQLGLFYQTVTSGEAAAYFRRKSAAALRDLRDYLLQRGVCDAPGKIALVDIGWRGTIQDNLCRLLPQKTIYGYYLGLIPVLNRQPGNAVKKGFINALPFSGALLKSHTQLEMVCTSQHGSILSYRRTDAGAVMPVRERDAQDLYSWNGYARYFQEGVLEAIREARAARRFGIKEAAGLLRMTLCPNKAMARAFFRFRYSERFGLGVDVDQSKLQFSLRPFIGALRGSKGRKELRLYLNKTMWPQGFMRVHGLSALIPLYDVVLLFTTNSAQGACP